MASFLEDVAKEVMIRGAIIVGVIGVIATVEAVRGYNRKREDQQLKEQLLGDLETELNQVKVNQLNKNWFFNKYARSAVLKRFHTIDVEQDYVKAVDGLIDAAIC